MTTVAETTTPPPVEHTEHPYVVRVTGVCGGRPIVQGSRIAVWHIAKLFKAGQTPDEISQEYHHLPPASIYDVISYYIDHQAEIEQDIAENRIEAVMARHNLTMDEQGKMTLGAHPQFLALVERSRARQKAEGGIPSAEVHRHLGLEKTKHSG